MAQSEENVLPESGNVGIGTTSPSAKLDVKGKVIIDSTLIVKDSVVFEKDTHIKQKLVVDEKVVMKEDAVVRQNFRVQGKSRFDSTAVFNDKIRFTNITSIPNFNNREILLINQNGLIQKSGVETLIDIVYSKDCSLSGNTSGVVLNPTWKNGPNKIFVNCPDVFVGIATNNPRVSLDVRGTAYNNKIAIGSINPVNMEGFFHLRTNNNQNQPNTIFLVERPNLRLLELNNQGLLKSRSQLIEANGANIPLQIKYESNSNVDIFRIENQNTGLIPFSISSNGNLRIKNNSRDVFHVNIENQTVFARKIIVDEQTWPDYVFEENYELTPLNEVKEFISQHGHLPNVPSREEILNTGVDVGTMVKILLEKVEELTLHSIQQQEEIEKLKEALEINK